MKCSKCGNDLGIESNSAEKVEYCSFCAKHDFPEGNSIEEVLRWIVQDRGVEVFQNSSVINAILSDLAPKDEKSRIKIKNAMAVGAGEYFYGIVQQGTLNDVSRKQFLSALSSNGFTLEFCNFIFDVFAYSINQSVAVQEEETSKTSANDSYKNIAVNTEQNNKNVSHNTKTDTKRDKEEIVKGEKTWPDGTIYKGELLDNMCHGKGVLTWPNGDKFEGEFCKGRRRKGTYTFSSGSIYKGEYLDDLCHGKGVKTWPSGDKFEGEFCKGNFKKGTYTKPDGTVYKGEFLDDVRHGKGATTWPDGSKFEGEYCKNKRRKGTYTFADGKVYKGEFLDDMCHGKGVVTFPNGSIYEGEFSEGMHHGKGVMTGPDGTKFEGEFCKGKRKKGTYTFPDGSIYKGDFLDDVRHGKGTMTWPDGTIYDGDWKNDKLDGTGITTLPNKQQYLQTYSQGNLINERELEITDRDKLCFCGSGMMYKNCHLKKRF